MVIFQVTIPASGKVQITAAGAGLPVNINPNTYVQQLVIQNNTAHALRIGDTTVSTTKGIALAAAAPGASFSESGFMNYGSYLSDWWIVGTAADVIDVLYVP